MENMTDGMAGPRPGKAVGEDLRRRAVAAVLERGMSYEAAARKFEVGTTSVFRWVQRFRAQGNFEPGRPRGRPSRIGRERARILRILEERPDISGRALRHALAAEGAVFSASSVQRFLARHRLDRKTRLTGRRGQTRADGT